MVAKRRRRARGVPKASTIAIYAGVFALIVAIVAIGYRPPQQSTVEASAVDVDTSSQTVDQTSVDSVVAANIASNVAQVTDLSVAPAVANSAISAQIESQVPQATDTSISKPQIVQPTSTNRSVITYKVKSGDTVASVAAHFGISTTTVKWANNLASNSLTKGTVLQILPVNGVLYTVKSGDTVASIASKYKVNQSRLVLYNDLDLGGLKVGSQIILPSATLPADQRPGYVAPTTTYSYYSSPTRYGYSNNDLTVVNPYNYISVSVYASRAAAGNKNYNGQCTWYAWERRLAIGRPLPSSVLGNASEWAYSLGQDGYLVNSSPSVGAIIQNGGGAGHVGVVEKVNADGSILISEMNNLEAGGSYVVDIRTIPAYAIGYFNYIH